MVTVIPYFSPGWSYITGGPGVATGFQNPSYDVSSWAVGTGAFGNRSDAGPGPINTTWPSDHNSDICIRRTVPYGLQSCTINARIDDNVAVWVNGTLVFDNNGTISGAYSISPITLGNTVLNAAAENVFAFRARDRRAIMAYLDVEIVATEAVVLDCTSGELLDTFWVNSRVHDLGNPAQSNIGLGSGVVFRVAVDGNHDVWGNDTTLNADRQPIKYPASGDEVVWASRDAEVFFAREGSRFEPVHHSQFRMNPQDGGGMRHIEPSGGPFSVSQPDFEYSYWITGGGNRLLAGISDSPLSDNSGQYRVRIYCGGGGGWQQGIALR